MQPTVIILGVVILLVIFLSYFYFQSSKSIQTQPDVSIVTFNAPYQIHIQNLIDILNDLHSINENEFDLHTILYVTGNDLPPPHIPFNKYFSIDNKTCTVTKFERKQSGEIELCLHFNKTTEVTN
jgi:hypothetical protein